MGIETEGQTGLSTSELGRIARKNFSELSEAYPGSRIYLGAGISQHCKNAPYSPSDLLRGFTGDEEKLDRLARAINRRHSGHRRQNGIEIPEIDTDILKRLAEDVFGIAEKMMQLTFDQLRLLRSSYIPLHREYSENLGKTKLRNMGIDASRQQH